MIPDAAGHLVVASVLGAPAAILISLIMVPEKPEERAAGDLEGLAPVASNTMDAIVRGTMAGLELLLNICAMLIVLIALVHLVNAMLGLLPAIAGAPVTLERMLGVVMAPVCWLMGIPWSEAVTAGALMGLKTILNEFVAYLKLAALPADALEPALAADHALCAVRLRQFRQPRHHDRRPRHHGPGAARRRGLARLQVDRIGHAVDLPDRRHRRRADVRATAPRPRRPARGLNAAGTPRRSRAVPRA